MVSVVEGIEPLDNLTLSLNCALDSPSNHSEMPTDPTVVRMFQYNHKEGVDSWAENLHMEVAEAGLALFALVGACQILLVACAPN